MDLRDPRPRPTVAAAAVLEVPHLRAELLDDVSSPQAGEAGGAEEAGAEAVAKPAAPSA